MRKKSNNKKQCVKNIKQINNQIQKIKQKNKKQIRKKVKPYDLEKAAIIYLNLFMKTKDVNKIDYPTFYNTWIKWFPMDDYGCGKVIKESFKKTVENAGSAEESIKSYRDTVKIFTIESITPDEMKEINDLAMKKGCFIERADNLEKNLSGFCVKRNIPSKYQCNMSNILLGKKYECSYELVKKYLLSLPDIEDLRSAQENLRNVLITDATIKEKIDAIHKYPYRVSTYDFDLYLEKFVRKCDSWGVLINALKLCNRLNVTNTINGRPLDVSVNRNAKKSLEQLDLFSSDKITQKVITSCIKKSGISTDYTEWTKEDFNKFTDILKNDYPAKYQYIRDRKSDLKDYKLWILNKYTNKEFKTLEKEMRDFLK